MKNFRLTVILLVVGTFVLIPAVGNAQSKNKTALKWFNKGFAEEDLNKKIEYYTKAINIDPNYVDAYNNRGNAYYYLERYVDAIADHTKAINVDPTYVKAYNNRGTVYRKLERYKEAMEDINKAISIKPDYWFAYYTRGLCYKALGEKEKAQADFKKACDGWEEDACKELEK